MNSPDNKTHHYQRLNAFQLPSGFRGRSAVTVQAWWLVQATLFAWSPQFMYGWRRFLLRLFGANIAQGVLIRPSATITYPWKVKIGDFSWVGDEVVLYSLGEIEIGKHSVISQRSYICTASHNYTSPDFSIHANKNTIDDEAWIATDVFIAPGVTIGRGCVVRARSSVFSDMPSGMICGGSPAKSIRPRASNESPGT